MSVEATDRAAQAVQKEGTKRVSLEDIKNEIKNEHFFLLGDALFRCGQIKGPYQDHPTAVMTICVLVLKNGFTVLGKSAAADPKNFNREYGQRVARDDAIRQIWPLLGYELRSKLNSTAGAGDTDDGEPKQVPET